MRNGANIASLVGGGFLVTLTLSAAHLLALQASPVQILPAPGPGRAVVPVLATAQYKFGTAAYANVAGAEIAIGSAAIMGSGESPVQFDAPGLIDQVQNMLAIAPSDSVEAQSDFENQALVVANVGGAGEFTTGDGELVIVLLYFVVNLL